jgi:hypothetical protein
MSIDPSIYRAANLLVEKYGDLAPMGATIKADSLREAGRTQASEQWMLVAKMAEELLSSDVPADAAIH